MFLIGDFERSLVEWYRARTVRGKVTRVTEASAASNLVSIMNSSLQAIDKICQTIIASLSNCFSAFDTDAIIQVKLTCLARTCSVGYFLFRKY